MWFGFALGRWACVCLPRFCRSRTTRSLTTESGWSRIYIVQRFNANPGSGRSSDMRQLRISIRRRKTRGAVVKSRAGRSGSQRHDRATASRWATHTRCPAPPIRAKREGQSTRLRLHHVDGSPYEGSDAGLRMIKRLTNGCQIQPRHPPPDVDSYHVVFLSGERHCAHPN